MDVWIGQDLTLSEGWNFSFVCMPVSRERRNVLFMVKLKGKSIIWVHHMASAVSF